MIYVGTSGFSFQSWRGVFYPAGLPDNKRLEFYCRHFNSLEINSTYYHPPSMKMVASLAARTPPQFPITVKLHRSLVLPQAEKRYSVSDFVKALAPLSEVGKLAGILAQFPQSFRNVEANRSYVLSLREEVGNVPLVVEFRHESWNRPAMFGWLGDEDIAFCCVDEPQGLGLMPGVVHATANLGYVRLHGRNAANWARGGNDRYDYLYSEEELSVWAERVRELERCCGNVFFFANNCYTGKAVINAKMFQKLLALEDGG